MKVLFIREMENKRIRIGIGDGDDVCRYTLSALTLSRLGLVRGMEIDEEMLSEIETEDASYRALKKALSLLSYGDNTAHGLFLKLLRAGFSREISEEAVAECQRLGYIDERRQLRSLILNDANRSLYGPAYILRRLGSKGYKTADIREITDELIKDGEIDFTKNFKLLCEKRGATDPNVRYALLYKYGYRSGDYYEEDI
ncbi:MAG: RecX family transcriptional regulator [Clostridia bacterium]|nr:RecX family transcriptional regulator [Clostridia bacterium]